jgi:hypothetical protein
MPRFKNLLKLPSRRSSSVAVTLSDSKSSDAIRDEPNGSFWLGVDSQKAGSQRASSNLWELAYQDLQAKEPTLADEWKTILTQQLGVASIPTARVDEGIAASFFDEKLKNVKDKQWVIKVGGKNLELRKSIFRAIKVLEIAMYEVAAPAANINPIYIGFPLAGVCIVLSVSYRPYRDIDLSL